MVLPNYCVIGAAKCATTALCTHLGKHPDVFMSRPKEPMYFSHDEIYERGWEWYCSLFSGANAHRAVGEGSTTYTMMPNFPKSAERMAEHLPDLKLIYIVRDPLDRICSMWMERRSQGTERGDFNSAVVQNSLYVNASRYWSQLSAYREHYPDNRILILFYEEFQADPPGALRSCFKFLGVDSEIDLEDSKKPVYSSAGKREDLAFTNFLRRHSPGFQFALRNLPNGFRSFGKKYLKRPIKGRPDWDDSVRRKVEEKLKEDTPQFLIHCERPTDLWDKAVKAS